jgi:type IV pilus assembly protein PilA
MKSLAARHHWKGFTLIELMIVVAIIGILAAIAVPNFVKFQCRSKQSEAKTNLKSMYVAQEAYRAEFDEYVAVTACGNNGTACGSSATTGGQIGWSPKGTKVRYNYDATVTNTAGAPEFLGKAVGTGDVNGDTWTVNQDNQIKNDATTNPCD